MSITIKQHGFTLVEVLVYAACMVLLVGATFSLLIAIYSWYTTATVGPRTDRVGMAVADQLVRDIRSGKSITSGSFGTTNGSVTLSAIDNGTTVTRYLYLSGGRVIDQENGGSIQYLSPADTSVTRLMLTQITTLVSKAIKFDMDITYSIKGTSQTKTYSGVAILRNSYQ